MSAKDSSHPPLAASARWLALALGLGAYAFLLLRFRFVCDDAYISFRYARNWAEGHGLIYNLGVDPPVEGYSEFLWVVWIALGLKLGIAAEWTSLALSGLAGAGIVATSVGLMAKRVAGTPAALAGGALMLGALPTLAVWSSGGMATAPFAWAVLLLFERLYGDEDRVHVLGATFAAIAAALLRADGAYWVAAVAGPSLLGFVGERRDLTRGAMIAAAVSAVCFGVHVAWRYSVYGDWLPNTARVKLGFSAKAFERGSHYLAGFALVFPLLAAAFAFGLTGLRARRLVLPMSLVVFATLLYAILVGGDFMAFGRFLLPALPFAVMCWSAAWSRLEAKGAKWVAGLCLVASVCVSVGNLLPAFNLHLTSRDLRGAFNVRHNGPPEFRSEYEQWQRMRDQALEWKDLGKAVAALSPEGASLVFPAVGAIGYFSRLFVFDSNGLVTREVALREPLPIPTSPGHDKTVPPTFFLKDNPTWLSAHFLPKGHPAPTARARNTETVIHLLTPEQIVTMPTREDGDRVVLIRPRP